MLLRNQIPDTTSILFAPRTRLGDEQVDAERRRHTAGIAKEARIVKLSRKQAQADAAAVQQARRLHKSYPVCQPGARVSAW